MTSATYEAITRGIIVRVETDYLDTQSDPDRRHYVWSYSVEIENTGEETVQLQSRYWNITDAAGQVQEVRGAGVVGEQPILRPGDRFRYTSGTPLNTPSGFMFGRYQMRTLEGEGFEIDVPMFSLDSPHEKRNLN